MELRFTAHARRRIEQRGVTRSQIIETLQNPDITMPGDSEGTTKFEKNLGKVVCVVAVNESYPRIIVTAFFKD